MVNKYKDKRIRYIKNEKNLGLTNSLINGIKNSKGKYIARLDAGNIALKDRLKIQYNFLEKNTNYYLIGSSFELIDEDDHTICKVLAKNNLNYIKKNLPNYNCINHSTIMFRNEDRICYRSKFKYSQDYDFYLNLLSNNYTIGNIPEVLLKERLMPSSITYAKRDKQSYFENLAKQFYLERESNGTDSYESLNITENLRVGVKESKGPIKKLVFYKQKIYYLLYSGRAKEARIQAAKALKEGFDLKIYIYFLMSYFPALVRSYSRIKGLNYE